MELAQLTLKKVLTPGIMVSVFCVIDTPVLQKQVLETCTGNCDNRSVDLNFVFKMCVPKLQLQDK